MTYASKSCTSRRDRSYYMNGELQNVNNVVTIS